jgi:hypothetical protein
MFLIDFIGQKVIWEIMSMSKGQRDLYLGLEGLYTRVSTHESAWHNKLFE